jgi:nitrile hydratase accessory protein
MKQDTESRALNLAELPGLPRDDEGAVFAAPWEARAFALVVTLHQRGCFHWNDWVTALSSEIAADAARAGGTPYYELWLAAAEKLITTQGLLEESTLNAVRNALHEAQHHADAHDHDHAHDHHEHGHSH